MKGFFVFAVISALVLFCLFGQQTMSFALEGYRLFITAVFPALFPFLVLVNCLTRLSPAGAAGKRRIFTLIRSFFVASLSGSPAGSLTVESAFGPAEDEWKLIRNSLIAAPMNLCCPLFIIGTVSGGMLRLGRNALYLLLISHYGSALLMTLTVGTIVLKRSPGSDAGSEAISEPRIGHGYAEAFTASVFSAMQTMLRICGTLVFCFTVVRLVDRSGALSFLQPAVRYFVLGLFEMTSGIGALAGLSIPPIVKLCLIAFLSSFGGISVLLQVCSAAPTEPAAYFCAKLLHGFSAAFICFLLFPLFPVSEPVFSQGAAVFSRAVSFAEIVFVFALSVSASMLLTIGTLRRTRT